jgi:hypothetical protein
MLQHPSRQLEIEWGGIKNNIRLESGLVRPTVAQVPILNGDEKGF